ncbi:MAG TPA: DUF362 domain-containing protein [Pyrinomonadaceae bacterium]|nr:DUF362 domain-containing protein [Pyrinomonadaceae bacterium]
MNPDLNDNFKSTLALAEVPPSAYAEETAEDSLVTRAVARVAAELGWRTENKGPFGALIKPGARVLIKPNWVLHHNQGTGGMEPMITHHSVIKAVVHAVLQAEPAEVIVGDAPIQTCDFEKLLVEGDLPTWAGELTKADSRFKGIKDFRRTTSRYINGVRVAEENLRPEDEFVLFDLGTDSLLEPITDEKDDFRVTCYDPRLMAKTHARGRHRYLVARDVIAADVVINLPKLKTHKKAGITCALKNLIGINGNKEYLPHHRIGGTNLGGDCYPGESKIKRILEYTADRQNTSESVSVEKAWSVVATQLNRMLHLMGDNLGIEGSWSGNDTIWRTGLDLNRILLYGELDGGMAATPRRRVVHVVDAIVAGQGDGPLSPLPLPLGLLFAGDNAAYVDWFGAQLLGYDPQLISIVRGAFENFQWPITTGRPEEITVSGDWGKGNTTDVIDDEKLPKVIHPIGWRDAARPALAEQEA